MTKWISIEDELPLPMQQVIFFYSGRYIETGFMESKDVYYTLSGCWDSAKETMLLDPVGPGRLTHWMPLHLPEPPIIRIYTKSGCWDKE